MANSKVFCNVPWHKIFIRSTGHYASCCVMKENLDTSTVDQMRPDEWFHSPEADKIRLAMLGQEPVSACSKCYYNEQIGYESSRIKDNYKSFIFPGEQFDRSYSQSPWHTKFELSRANQGATDLPPRDYMLSLGNECNLACKMCFPIWSSRIADRYQSWNLLSDQLDVRNNWTANESTWKRVLESLANNTQLVRLTLLGGETTMNKEFYELVDFLLEHNRTDVVLHFVTNATLYRQDTIDKLKRFKGLYIEFSLESVTANNHYIRQGSDTAQVVANILRIQSELKHNTNFTISSAPQALSINTYDQLIRWAWANRIPIQGHPVTRPAYFNVAVLPTVIRQDLIPRYQALAQELAVAVSQETSSIAFGSDPNRISQLLLNETHSMIQMLQQPEPDNVQRLQQEMIDWMMRWDQEFGLDARDYYPEYQHWLNEMKWTIMFDTRIQITVVPKFHQEPPRIRWSLDGHVHDVELREPLTITVDQPLTAGDHRIEIEFYNKTAADGLAPVDKAVEIQSVQIEGLSTTKLSQGTYYPEFPEPWASEQQAQGIDVFETYRTSTYLGWNGRWVFEFACPIYQWIHRTENLGFSYV